MKLAIVSLCALLGTCTHTSPPASTDNRQSVSLGVSAENARGQLNDQIAGNITGAKTAVNTLPESRAKDVTLTFLDGGLSLTGQPLEKTKSQFVEIANKLLSEDAAKRASAEQDRLKLAGQNETLKETIKKLESDYKTALIKEHERAEAEKQAAILAAKLEAEAKDRKLISCIFFGGSFLLLVAAAVVFTTAAQVPMFGPKVAFGLGGAAAVSAGTGVSILELLNHPNVVWWGLGIVIALLIGAASLAYANHHHHVNE